MKVFIIIVLLSLFFIPLGSCGTPVMDEYLNSKMKYLNTQDWGPYSYITGNFYIIIDGQDYLIQTTDGKIAELKSGIPVAYDCKIVTNTKDVDKWFKIVEHYLEHGKLTCYQKYVLVPWLTFKTPIERTGYRGNFAFMIHSMSYTGLKLVD